MLAQNGYLDGAMIGRRWEEWVSRGFPNSDKSRSVDADLNESGVTQQYTNACDDYCREALCR